MIRAVRALPIVSVLVVGSLLFHSAHWRLTAERASSDADKVYRDIKQEGVASPVALTTSRAALEVASKANPGSSLYLAELADLALRQAQLSKAGADQPAAAKAFRASRKYSIQALSRGPSDPYAWYALSYSQQALTGLSGAALRYLTMSFEIGAIEGQLLISRISFCYAYWESLPDDLRERSRQQIRLALDHYQLVTALADYTVSLRPEAQPDFIKLVETASEGHLQNFNRFAYWVRVKKAAVQSSPG